MQPLQMLRKILKGMIRYKATSSYERMKNDDEKPDTTEIKVFCPPEGYWLLQIKKMMQKQHWPSLILPNHILNKEKKKSLGKETFSNHACCISWKGKHKGYSTTSIQAQSYLLSMVAGCCVLLAIGRQSLFSYSTRAWKNEELVMIVENRILLKVAANLSITSSRTVKWFCHSFKQFSSDITLTAVEIKPGKINPEILRYPPVIPGRIFPTTMKLS